MVAFGLFGDWHPEPGRLTTWTASPAARAAVRRAPAHDVGPSYQQRAYLRATHRNSRVGLRVSRICMISFDIPGVPDHRAMTAALNAFLRRHDTFHSWFAMQPDGRIVRHVADPADIEVTATSYGEFDDLDALRERVRAETPGPFEWDCFSFGVIERPGSFTMYAAVDHLHTDGVAQALSCVELLLLYGGAVSGETAQLPPVDGHIGYCERENIINEQLGLESAAVWQWLDLLRRNDGDVPRFPLELGGGGYAQGAQLTRPLLTEDEMLRFEQVCAAHGGRFLGGLFAAIALAELELAGRERYFGLTPANTRFLPGETGSVGWYTNLIPVEFEVCADNGFTAVVAAAQRAAERAKDLTDVSLHRVLELVTPDLGIRARPGFTAPMVSYVDVRKMDGADLFDAIKGGLYGSETSSGEVFLWVNRFHDVTTLSLLFPDTPRAHASVVRYVRTLTAIINAVVADGDYAARVPALS
ncbi:condensation domain-containing protein [Nocardia acidivorans]|uniref:condensation domain-containing protein n=1 Tax=Nocardia acidivorans TaxID=404580 RepID=UPI00082D8001|nr:condensation domain-containing protein [Nocardia acidivorans]